MRRSWVLAALVAVAGPLAARGGEILNIGDPAPPLKVSKWVKGEPVGSFAAGQTVVVEFWATWCGPCRSSIPHLTELAHQYKDVRFVGVDVWERDLTQVEPFLKEMGSKMDYSVALDDVAEGQDANSGAMATTWMKAAEENGIPAAFVVRDGKIAWIGHPMEMDGPLKAIVAGTYEAGSKAAERLAEKAKERKMSTVRTKVYGPFRKRDYQATLAAIDESVASDPSLAEELAPVRYASLCNSGQVEAGLKLGDELLERNKDSAGDLSGIFMGVVADNLPKAPDPRVVRQALRAAERAVELTKGKDYSSLTVLADAQARSGDPAAAMTTQEKAITSLKGIAPEGHPIFKQLQSKVDRLRQAAEAKAGKP